MGRHLIHLLIFSALVSAFFAVWAGDGRRTRVKIGGGLLVGMIGTSLLLAWLMYLFTR